MNIYRVGSILESMEGCSIDERASIFDELTSKFCVSCGESVIRGCLCDICQPDPVEDR